MRNLFKQAARFSNTLNAYKRPDVLPKLTSSYCHNPGSGPLINTNIDEVLQKTVTKFPERPAFTYFAEGKTDSWSDINTKAAILADSLLKLGVKKGDKVAMWGPSIPEWVVTQFACAKAGFVLVTLNPLYTKAECEQVTNFVGVKAIICPPKLTTMNDYQTSLSWLGIG